METVVESSGPRQLLKDLQEFTESCRGRLSELLQELGWERERPEEADDTVVCPYDAGHRMPEPSLEKHVAVCRLRKLGYSMEEAKVPNTQFFYEKTNTFSIAFDKEQQFQIIKQAKDTASSGKDNGSYDKGPYSSSPVEVPHNHKRAVCDLTPADRLAIYDHVLEEAKKKTAGQVTKNESDLFEDLAAKINQGGRILHFRVAVSRCFVDAFSIGDDSQKGPKSHLEIIAEMRDYKRRRQSYRAKNVHITKKSYTEIIRDVIGVHMEELSSHWRDEMREEANSTPSSSVKRRESQRSPSVESRQSDGSYRDKKHHRSQREHSSRHHRRKKKSKKMKERDEEKHSHSHKKKKQK